MFFLLILFLSFLLVRILLPADCLIVVKISQSKHRILIH
nr:MAG TPA: Cell division protein [Caudoviricetes sp.]